METTKSTTIKTLAQHLDLPETTVWRVMTAFEEHVIATLKAGDVVNVRGIVRLTPTTVRETVRRNPATGEKITVPEHVAVKAKVFKSLQSKIK